MRSTPVAASRRTSSARTSGAKARLVEQPVELGGVVLGRPRADQRVELVLALAAGGMGAVALVVGELGAAHRRAQPPEDVVAVGGDDDPGPVARAVEVRRRDAL